MASPILRSITWLKAVPGGDHLVVECDRCDRTDKTFFPLTAEALGHLTRGYQEVHRDCQPRVKP